MSRPTSDAVRRGRFWRVLIVLCGAGALLFTWQTATAQKAESAAPKSKLAVLAEKVKAPAAGLTAEQRMDRLEKLFAELVEELSAQETRQRETSPPFVVATLPKTGDEAVDPAVTEIRVTFNKEMMDGSWSFVSVDKDKYPASIGKPRFEADRTTCILPVKLEPGKSYLIGVNYGRFNSFRDLAGRPAPDYILRFSTRP